MRAPGNITIASLSAASAVAASAMIHGAGKFEWNGFYPWVIGPYLLLVLMFVFPLRQSEARSIAGCVAAILVLAFTCLFYIDAMWFSVSSTSALIFIFAPMYLLVGGLAAWGLAWLLLKRRAENSSDRV